MMTACTCMVQEDQISADQEQELRARMSEFAERSFGSPPDIQWTVVAKRNGFTEAKPSNSVLIMMTSHAELHQSEREKLLRELCEIWMDETGLDANEVVTVIRDPLD